VKPVVTDNSAAALWLKKAVLDGALLVDLIVSFTAIAAAWFFRMLEIDMTRIAWSYFAFTGAHVVFMAVTDRLQRRAVLLSAITIVQAAGIVFLAMMWHFAGGLANPTFLFAVVAPLVVVGVMNLRWLGLVLGMLAWVSTCAVALTESPELVWVAERYGLAPGLFKDAIAVGADAPAQGGMDMTPSALLAAFGLFGVVALTAAPGAQALASRAIRIHQRSLPPAKTAAGAAVPDQAIATIAVPTVILYADSGQIHSASTGFINQMLLSSENLRSRTIFELVKFDEPRIVKQALEGTEPVLVGYRVGTEHRVASLHMHHFFTGGDAFILLRIEEANELHYLTAVEASLEEAKLVISRDGRVRYFNAAAAGLFEGIHFGMKAETILGEVTNSESWWSSGRAEGLVLLGGERFVIHNSFTEFQGERLALIELRPVKKTSTREAGSGSSSPRIAAPGNSH
jgi:hypothetical protein